MREVRKTSRSATAVRRRREIQQQGFRSRRKLVLLQLLKKYSPEEAMLGAVAKLLLPSSVWQGCDDSGVQGRLSHVQRLLAHPRVLAAAEEAWANRETPKHVRLLRRAKRLTTEFKIYGEVLLKNSKGVTPKRDDMVRWLRQYWPYTGDSTDSLPAAVLVKKGAVERWMRRFRRFWNVAFKKLPIHAETSLAVQELKVFAMRNQCSRPNLVHIRDPFLASFLGPSCSIYTREVQNLGQKMVQVLVAVAFECLFQLFRRWHCSNGRSGSGKLSSLATRLCA